MKRVVIALLTLLMPLLAAAEGGSAAATANADPFVGGDATAGAAKAPLCFACHGPGGSGAVNPLWPKLAGQHSAYIYGQLSAFHCASLAADQRGAAKCTDIRSNPIMMAQEATLSDQDMRNLAAYFASQKPVPGLGRKEAVAVGEKLYRSGDAARGLPACAACHGPTGAGNAAAQFPRIGGQNPDYAAGELRLYRTCGAANFQNCERGGADKAQMMSTVAAKLSDAEIDALAGYIAGLQ